MKNPFENKTDEELKVIYKEIFKSREKGLRPRVLDPYIQDVRCFIRLLFLKDGNLQNSCFGKK